MELVYTTDLKSVTYNKYADSNSADATNNLKDNMKFTTGKSRANTEDINKSNHVLSYNPMEWKEFKEKVTTEIEGGSKTEEKLVKIFCRQGWLPNCEYKITPENYGYRATFVFKESEEYVITHKDLDIVKEFCNSHLKQIKENLVNK